MLLKLDAVGFEDVAVYDDNGRALDWQYDGDKITIRWAKPFSKGEQRQVVVAYRVTKPTDGVHFSHPNDAYPDNAWFAATDHETERARYWLPCIDLPNVRTTLDFHLRTESRFTILANGLLISQTEHEDDTKTAHWQLEQRCPSYLVCFAIGDLVRADDGLFDDGQKQIELAYFCTPEHSTDDLLRTFGKTGAIMAWMTKKLGRPFPYPKYYQFAVPGLGGAMENISLVGWDDRMIQDETLALEMGWWVDRVNVHEMAHSYFGDAIVCRDFAHAWLKESWATYMDHCWCEDNWPDDIGPYTYHMHASRYIKEADEKYQLPIVTRKFKSSWQMYDSHLYPGGSCRLHTLRHELGENTFWTAVNDYLVQYDGKVVETEDFRRVMEAHSGRSLGQFFDQWFYTAGYPALKIEFDYDSKLKQGRFEIEQTQVNNDKSVPAFVLNSDLAWIIDGQESRLAIRLDQAKHTFLVAMSAMPQQVRFDPDHKVLHKLDFNPGDLLLRHQLTADKDVIGRILAAGELVKTGKLGNIKAVVDAYANEPFWGVRREIGRILSKANNETAVAGLAQFITDEQHPMALEALFEAVKDIRDQRLQAAIVGRLKQGMPYFATESAYIALGKQRHAAPFPMLLEASQQDSFNGIVQSGALEGLAATRSPEAFKPLLERVQYGATSNRARDAAVTALADFGQGQERTNREQIVETLTDLLRDPWPRVGWAAAAGLGEMKATKAIPALEAYEKTLAYQDQVYVEKLIKKLRNEDKLDGSALKKQVEILQDKLRKLENQVQRFAAEVKIKNDQSS